VKLSEICGSISQRELDLLRKSFRHREYTLATGASAVGEKELFSKVSVGSVAKQKVTYARGQFKKTLSKKTV
jgi:hypothetical protein